MLSEIGTDSYIVAGIDDHIVPWRVSYRTTQLFKGRDPLRDDVGRPHRRHREPAGPEGAAVDQRRAAARRRRVAGGCGRAPRHVVERLGDAGWPIAAGELRTTADVGSDSTRPPTTAPGTVRAELTVTAAPCRAVRLHVAAVHREQRLLLVVAERRRRAGWRTRCRAARRRRRLVDDAGVREQRLGREVEGAADRLQHADRRLVEPPLELAQVRVRHVGEVGHLAQREVGELALRPDERSRARGAGRRGRRRSRRRDADRPRERTAAPGPEGGSGPGPAERAGDRRSVRRVFFAGVTASTTLIAKSFCVPSSSSAKPKLDSTTALGLGSWSTNGSESSSGMVNALPAKSIQRLMPLKARSWPCFTPARTASVNTAVGSAVLVAMVVSIEGSCGGWGVGLSKYRQRVLDLSSGTGRCGDRGPPWTGGSVGRHGSAADGRAPVLSVHAHPDDEASKGAATMARYGAEGVRTVLVTCTGGEAGDILNPEADTEDVRADLAAVRRRELDDAVRIIGYDALYLLGYRDSGMPDTEPNAHPDNFANADLDEAVGRLVEIIRGRTPPGAHRLRPRPRVRAPRPRAGARDHGARVRTGRRPRLVPRARRAVAAAEALLHERVHPRAHQVDARLVRGAGRGEPVRQVDRAHRVGRRRTRR